MRSGQPQSSDSGDWCIGADVFGSPVHHDVMEISFSQPPPAAARYEGLVDIADAIMWCDGSDWGPLSSPAGGQKVPRRGLFCLYGRSDRE
ncbi:hypothetical protein THAOC_32456 [Thalassiosira oceanica]|uniref:Uncharacterized protein n=1 Tax=Thalassiosira oceanica TaxID=159749 RepID=K0RIM9_THAOC|nr:hypothetical protein THAOC_32456 [Thalassiosira oceanica]|eukprot:EJK48721.1 hypothetical protein THAOC_32456 [Thalassiosira oceanica]